MILLTIFTNNKALVDPKHKMNVLFTVTKNIVKYKNDYFIDIRFLIDSNQLNDLNEYLESYC